LILEPLRTLRPDDKGQAGACPDRTRAIPCKVRAVTGQFPGTVVRRAPLRRAPGLRITSVPPRCPRIAIISQRPPPAATRKPEASAGLWTRDQRTWHSRNV